MRWQAGQRSTNIEDRRGQRVTARTGVKIGGGLSLVVIVVGLLLGKDLSGLTNMLSSVTGGGTQVATGTDPAPPAKPPSPEEQALADFISVILADTEDVWTKLLPESGTTYRVPKLVLFSEAVESACGYNTAAVGPFYCPPDEKVYIDLIFYKELHARFKAPGDFAQAYVVAHEVGHRVQGLLGISQRVRQQKKGLSEAEGNQLSVRQELQADCFAGIWAHHAQAQRQLLEQGDVQEGLRAAAAIGDDRLQKQAGRAVSPETWAHGSSEQRVRWFKTGMTGGNVQQCDTFAAAEI